MRSCNEDRNGGEETKKTEERERERNKETEKVVRT